jgi:asparagine synthase (glutamine-hydrolysing)
LSGIAGAILVDRSDMSDAFLGRIADAATPRGFDGISRWRSGSAGLIRFHHATTPEAVGEVQPLAGPSGAVIAFDGRLDNRADLLALLGARGAILAHAPDVAVALALFEARGERFLEDLVGDWALAIWRPDARRLFCARSPMGWRPFLWTFDGSVFAFATEPRALIVGLRLDRALNEGAIGEFLAARFVTESDTLWRHVSRLPQGEALVLEDGRVRRWHWHNGPFEDLSRLSDGEHVERFRELFDTALISAMRSSTPVMAHLSGGLDSSSVVCRATQLHRAGRIDRQVGAITARFPGHSYDESEWSGLVEAQLGITAEVTPSEPYDLDAAGKWCADTLQLPIRPNVYDTSTIAFRRLHAEGRRVLLTGEGGDEWMAGTFAHFPDLLRQLRIAALFHEAMTQFPEASIGERLRRMATFSIGPHVSRDYRARMIRSKMVFDLEPPPWINAAWAKEIALRDRWNVPPNAVDLPTFAQQQRYAVFSLARRNITFESVQAYGEGLGVETRHPINDLRLTRFFMGAAGDMLRRRGEKKYLLREAMRGTLPEPIRTRQSKAQFVDNIVDTVLERFRRKPLDRMLAVQSGWLDADELVRRLTAVNAWSQHRPTDTAALSGLGALWFAVSLDIWLENTTAL